MANEGKSLSQLAVEALQTGGDLDAVEAGKPSVGTQESSGTPEVSQESSDDFFKGNQASGEPTEQKPQSTPPPSPAKTKEDPSEYYVVDGKRYKIDYSNKEAIRKAHEMAAGMRKAFAERDKLSKEFEPTRKERDELKQLWGTLEDLYAKKGIDGVVSALTNGQHNLDSLFQERQKRDQFRKEASPAELAAMDLKEQLETERQTTAKLRKEWEETKTKIEADKDHADMKSLESLVHPAFDQFRFAGKLGDEDAEHLLDSTLWNETLKRLEKYGDDVELSRELVVREFKKSAETMSRVMNKKAEEKANDLVQSKKTKAKENVQIEASRGYQANSTQEEAAKKIRGGDLKGILGDWDKFGSLFK
jgi:hypothetical protein